MLKICHISDWHGEQKARLPHADLYVHTGDALRNFPVLDTGSCHGFIKPERERVEQTNWAKKKGAQIPCPRTNATVVIIRGNHDFVSFAGMFSDWENVIEIQDDQVHNIMGLRMGGFRGMPWFGGGWSDEKTEPELDAVTDRMDIDLDLVISHCPPWGILDDAYGQRIGCTGYARYLQRRSIIGTMPKAILFGHCHEGYGVTQIGGTIASNAATSMNIIYI